MKPGGGGLVGEGNIKTYNSIIIIILLLSAS